MTDIEQLTPSKHTIAKIRATGEHVTLPLAPQAPDLAPAADTAPSPSLEPPAVQPESTPEPDPQPATPETPFPVSAEECFIYNVTVLALNPVNLERFVAAEMPAEQQCQPMVVELIFPEGTAAKLPPHTPRFLTLDFEGHTKLDALLTRKPLGIIRFEAAGITICTGTHERGGEFWCDPAKDEVLRIRPINQTEFAAIKAEEEKERQRLAAREVRLEALRTEAQKIKPAHAVLYTKILREAQVTQNDELLKLLEDEADNHQTLAARQAMRARITLAREERATPKTLLTANTTWLTNEIGTITTAQKEVFDLLPAHPTATEARETFMTWGMTPENLKDMVDDDDTLLLELYDHLRRQSLQTFTMESGDAARNWRVSVESTHRRETRSAKALLAKLQIPYDEVEDPDLADTIEDLTGDVLVRLKDDDTELLSRPIILERTLALCRTETALRKTQHDLYEFHQELQNLPVEPLTSEQIDKKLDDTGKIFILLQQAAKHWAESEFSFAYSRTRLETLLSDLPQQQSAFAEAKYKFLIDTPSTNLDADIKASHHEKTTRERQQFLRERREQRWLAQKDVCQTWMTELTKALQAAKIAEADAIAEQLIQTIIEFPEEDDDFAEELANRTGKVVDTLLSHAEADLKDALAKLRQHIGEKEPEPVVPETLPEQAPSPRAKTTWKIRTALMTVTGAAGTIFSQRVIH